MAWLTSMSCAPGAILRTAPFIAATYKPSRPKSLVRVRIDMVRASEREAGDRVSSTV